MVALDPPEMRQSIAWEFVLMALRKRIAAEAEQDLSEGMQKRVRDVEVGMVLPAARTHEGFVDASRIRLQA